VKLQPFFRQRPQLWFELLEGQFELHDVTSDRRQYLLCLTNLPEDVVTMLDTSLQKSYGSLKQQTLVLFEKSRSQSLEEALNSLSIVGLRPSLALQKLRRSFQDANIIADVDVLRHRLLKAQPPSMQSILAAHQKTDLEEFVSVADAIFDFSSQATVSAVRSDNYSKAQSLPQQSPSLGLTPYKVGQKPLICRSHIFYGSEARRCQRWCKWPGPKPAVIDSSSRQPSRASSPAPAKN
jgi:hypothetical protein